MDVLKTLPPIVGKSREELLALLLEEEFGYLPAPAHTVTATEESRDEAFLGGKACLSQLTLTCRADFGECSFPVSYIRPAKAEGPMPAIVHINFTPDIPDKYQPTETLMDAGYAVLLVYYQAVSSDNADFTDGIAGAVYPNGERGETDCGKIGLWAWACMRTLDYALTLPELKHDRISVAGHSRLGKTALLAGAMDPRFWCAYSNDSGCSGAALARQKGGENIEKIVAQFPFWFCKKYATWVGREEELPFDQHALLAANAPHYVYVASAAEDRWADPKNEYLSCVAVSEYFESLGLSGFVHPDRLPEIGECFHEGTVGYHLREGGHYLRPDDWERFLKFLELKDA